MIKMAEKSLEQKANEDSECPKCRSKKITASNIRDAAFPIHYIDDIADFSCYDCGNKWSGQYGYRGLA